MVTFTRNNVKLSDNLIQTNDTFNILPYVHLLEPSPNKNGKFLCPSCGKNDFDYNRKTGKGLKCFSSVDNACHANKSYPIVKALKLKAGDWIEKNSNNSFTSDYTTNKHSNQLLQLDCYAVKVHKKFKSNDYKNNWSKPFFSEAINSPFQVCFTVLYQNYVKKNCKQTAINFDAELEISLEQAGIETKDVLPYYELGYKHLADDIKPERILIVEGQKTARECFNKFDGLLPAISVYGGANINQIPVLIEHLKLIPTLKEIVLSPDFDKKGLEYMFALSKELKQAGYSVKWLLPYPDSYWDRLNNLPDGHEAVDMFDYINEFSHLTAQEIIDQIKVISDVELERMLTGETVTAPSVTYSKSVKELINNDSSQGIEFLAGPFIQKGGSNMILGYSGAGKSTLSSQLAITLVQGGNFLGHEVKGGLKVLCVVTDETIAGFTSRVLQQGYDHDNENLRVIDTIDGDLFDVSKLQELKQEITQNQYDVVIIDSLSSTVSSVITGTENGPEIGKYLNEFIKVVSYECKSTFVIIHHSNKAGDDAPIPNLKAICGHSSLARPLDQVIFLRPSQGESDEVDLFTVKNRNGSKPSYLIGLNDERCFEFIKEITPTEATNTASSDSEKLIIDCLSQSDDWTLRKDIEAITSLSKSTCNELLSKLHSKGLIERDKVGKSYQYRLTDNRPTDRPEVYTNYQPVDETLDNTSLSIDRPTGHIAKSFQPVDSESINSDNLVESENTINVQSEVIENFPTSDKQDIVDTEKESKRDSIEVNGTTFKIGDYYWQNKAKITLVKIARFTQDREGVMGIGPRYEIDPTTGKPFTNNPDGEWEVCLDGDVYPYEG